MNTATLLKDKAANLAAALCLCALLCACQSSDFAVEKKKNGDTLEYTYSPANARGIWQTYDSQNGLARKTSFYSKNKKLFEILYYPDGQPKSIETISPDGKTTKINYDLDGMPAAKNAKEVKNEKVPGYNLARLKINLESPEKVGGESAKLIYKFQSEQNEFEATIYILPQQRDGGAFGKIHLKGKLDSKSGKLEYFTPKVYYGDWQVIGNTSYGDDGGSLRLDLIHIGSGKSSVSLCSAKEESDMARALKYKREKGADCVIFLPDIQIYKIKESGENK